MGRAERAPWDVPSGHRRHSAKQAQALWATVKVEATVKVVEYWLAQRPLSTGLPNGPLVLARPTTLSTGSPNEARPMSTGSPNEYGLAQPRLMARPTPRSGFFPAKKNSSGFVGGPLSKVSANLPGIRTSPTWRLRYLARHIPATCLA